MLRLLEFIENVWLDEVRICGIGELHQKSVCNQGMKSI